MIKPKPNVRRAESGFTDEELADWFFIAQKARKMKRCRLFRTKLVIGGKTIPGAVVVELRTVQGRGFIRPLAVMVRPEMAEMLPDFPLKKPTPEPESTPACACGPDEGPDDDGDPKEHPEDCGCPICDQERGAAAALDEEGVIDEEPPEEDAPDDDEGDNIPGAAEVEAVQATNPPQAEKPNSGPALVEKTPEPEDSKHGEEPHD